MTSNIRYITNKEGQLFKVDWSTYPSAIAVSRYDSATQTYVNDTATGNALTTFLNNAFTAATTVASKDRIFALHIDFDAQGTPLFAAQIKRTDKKLIYVRSNGATIVSPYQHNSSHIARATDGTLVSYQVGENKFRFVSASGEASTVRTSLKLRDVKIVNGANDSKLVWGLTKYGTLEITAFDAEGNLDTTASNAMFEFFNGTSANYIAIQTDATGRAYALDKDGYLHVFASNDNLSAMYKSAEPVIDLSSLTDLSYGRLAIDGQGNIQFVGLNKNGVAIGNTLTANVNKQIALNNLDLVSGKVSVSNNDHYLMKDGILYHKNGSGDWRPTEYSNLTQLKRNADGSAIALDGSDSVLTLAQDGSRNYRLFDLDKNHIVDAQVSNGVTYALSSDGKLHFQGSVNGSVSAANITNLEGRLTSFVVKDNIIFASTTQGKLVRFNVPTASGMDQQANAGYVVNGVAGVEAVLISPDQDIVTLNSKADGAYQYQKYDPATHLVTPVVDATFRGFNTATDIDDYGIIVTSEGRRFTLYDGTVYMYDQHSNGWLATGTTAVSKLKLGADKQLYALKSDGYLAQLNELGFIASTGVKVATRGDQTHYVAKAVFLSAGVTDFTVSASGSIYFVDQDGDYQKLAITDEQYGSISRIETSSEQPSTIANLQDFPTGVSAATHTAIDKNGRAWMQGADGRVFYSDAAAAPYAWVDVGKIDKANGFGLLEGGQVYVATSDNKKHFFDQSRWMEIQSTTQQTAANSRINGSRSIAVAGDGTLWMVSELGGVFKKGTAANATWEQATPDVSQNIGQFQRLKTLADGSVVGKTAEGKLYKQSPSGDWTQAHQDTTTRDFDALFDRLNFSRFQHEYQVLFFGSSHKFKSLFGYKLKQHNLSGALSQDIPAKGTTSNVFRKFDDWSAAHFRYHSTNASAGHHNDVSKAKKEILASFKTLLSRPPEFVENQLHLDIKGKFEAYKSTLDAAHAISIKRIRRLIELDLDNGSTNPDWTQTKAYKQFNSLFHRNKVNSNDNAIFRVYEYRKSAFGAADNITSELKSLLDAGVYMPAVDGDASAIIGQLVNDTALLNQARDATVLAQNQVNNGTSLETAKTDLDKKLADLTASQEAAAISKINKGNFNSLDKADRYFKTLDYLLGGLQNDKSKLTRALTRQGAVKEHVAARYIQLINSMKTGEALSLDAGWKLGAELGAGWSHAPGFQPVSPLSFGFAGIAGKVSAGGGNKYKLAIRKTDNGVDIEISFDRMVEVSPAISGSAGAGASVGVGSGAASASVGGSATLAYKFNATKTQTVTLSMTQDDKGTIQDTLDKLFKGTLDPYELLDKSKTGTATSGLSKTHSLDFTGTAGGGLSLGANTPRNDAFSEVRGAASITIASISLSANIFKAKQEAKLTYRDGLDMSREINDKRGFFNSLGISFTPVAASAGVTFRDYNADPAFDHDSNPSTTAINNAHSRGNLGRSATGFSYSFAKTWDRLETNLLPKDGYTLESGDKGIKSVKWAIAIQKTSRLFDQPKVKQLLATLPEVKEQLIKLASFTTPENRINIKTKLAGFAAKAGVNSSELAELNQLSDFLHSSDKKKFRKALQAFSKNHPELKSDIDALKSNLGSSVWRKVQQPIALSLELTPEALVKLNNYTTNDGNYQVFVNQIAQDAKNFRITSFAVTETHSYTTNGGLDALILKFSSDASLGLEKNTANIKVFYSDGPMVTDLEGQIQKLARADKSSVADADVKASIDRKVTALLESINTRFGNITGTEKTQLIAAINQLVAQPYDTTDVKGTIAKLHTLAAVPDPSRPVGKPAFTFSGDRLVDNKSTFNERLRDFNGAVLAGGEGMLSGLSNPVEQLKLGQTVQSVQQTARQTILKSYRSELDIDGFIAHWSETDSKFKAAIDNNSGTGSLSFSERIRALFTVNNQGQMVGSAADILQLKNEMSALVSANTVTELQQLYDNNQSALNDLVVSDLWNLYTDSSSDLMELHNGQIYYSVKDTNGAITKIVKVPHEVLKHIVQQEGMSLLDAMAAGHSGAFFLQEGTLDSQTLAKLASQPLVATPDDGFLSSQHTSRPRKSGYEGNHIVSLVEAIRDRKLVIYDLNAAQEYVLNEFFPTENGEGFDFQKVYEMSLDDDKLTAFKHVIDQATRSDVNIDLAKTDSGASLVEKVVNWKTITGETAASTGTLVTQIRQAGSDLTLRHVPQSLYLGVGSDQANGRCAGMGLGYLYMLSQGADSSVGERFLDSVVISAGIADASHQGLDTSTVEFTQNTDFRLLIDTLHSTGSNNALSSRGQQTLDTVFSGLASASGDQYLALNTGNHSLQLAKKSIAGQQKYYFYDPNIGRLEASSTADLKKAVQTMLSKESAALGMTLANYYQLESAGFQVSEFLPAQAVQESAFKDLNALVITDAFQTESSRLTTLGNVTVDGVNVSAIALYKANVFIDGGRVSQRTLTSLIDAGADGLSRLKFDRDGVENFFTSDVSDADKHALAQLFKKRLMQKSGDIESVFLTGNKAFVAEGQVDHGDLAKDIAEVINTKVSDSLVVSGDFNATLGAAVKQHRQQAIAATLSERLGLDNAATQSITELAALSERLTNVSVDDFTQLREKYPQMNDSQLLEIAATDSLRQSVRGLDGANDVINMAEWSSADAQSYLQDKGVLVFGPADPVNTTKISDIISTGTHTDRLRMVTALMKVDPALAEGVYRNLKNQEDADLRRLGLSLESNARPSKLSKAVDAGGNAFNTFETLNAIRAVISDWGKMTVRDKALTLTELVGGVALPTVVSKGISQAFKLAGNALGTVGKTVKAGVLDLILAPVSLAAIGLQWKDFWNNGGNTGSYEYKSLVANTVVTSVTLAASIALTGVSIAASVSAAVAGTTVAAAAAAGSTLAVIASAAGPIGIAIGAAAFLINGIVQGALQVAEYDEYFENVGDKVHQFFAAWIGVETEGLKKARANKQGEEAATETATSLLENWTETKKFLSDLFAKNGHKYLNVRDRSYDVKFGIIQSSGEWKHLLQQNTAYGELDRISSDIISHGSTVWAELGTKPGSDITGDAERKNLFNLDDTTELNRITGGNKQDAFNLTSGAKVNAINGGAGTDTLIWDANGMKVDADTSAKSAVLSDVSRWDPETQAYVSVNKALTIDSIENITIVNAKHNSVIKGGNEDNFFDVSTQGNGSADLYGGGGANVYVLNNGIKVHSTSNDTFLWKAGNNAQIHFEKQDGVQVAFIELPYHYDQLTVDRIGTNLKVSAPTGNDIWIYNVSNNKILQFKDKSGSVFSLNLPNEHDAAGNRLYPLSMDRISKSFVFTDQSSRGAAAELTVANLVESVYTGTSVSSASGLKGWADTHEALSVYDATELTGTLSANEVRHLSGLIYLEAGKAYDFQEIVDDDAYLLVNGQEVLSDRTWNSHTTGRFTATNSGYVSFDYYVRNGGGPGNYDIKAKVSTDPAYKALVVSEQKVTSTSATGPEYLYGDQAVTNYRFKQGSGHYVVAPRTQRIVTLNLDVAATDLQYRYVGTSLILEHQKDGKLIKLELTNYLSQKNQIQVYANNNNTADAVPVILNLPETGSGSLSEANFAQGSLATAATEGLLSVVRANAGDTVNLQSATDSTHYVATATDAASLNVSLNNASYLRVGDDLYAYDGEKGNVENGIQSLQHLRIEGYFSNGNSSTLKINGQPVLAASIQSQLVGHFGTDGNDRFYSNGAKTTAGGNGKDLYEVDMATSNTYVIDNYAKDQKYDTLRFYGVPDVKNLTLSSAGSDVILSYNNAKVILKNYNLETEARHLEIETYSGSDISFSYTLPAVISDSVYYYELDANEYQRVKLFNNDKPHFIDIPAGAHGAAYIEIGGDIATYTKEVLGNDLKLTSADGAEQVYLKNYYVWPKAISGFVWGGDSTPRNPGTYYQDPVLPDGNSLYQSLLSVGVERELVVRYANAGVTVDDAKLIVAHRNDKFLTEAGRDQWGAQSYPDANNAHYDDFAVHLSVNKRSWEAPYLLDQMDDSTARGFRVQLERDGTFSVDIRSNSYSHTVNLAMYGYGYSNSLEELSGELLIGVDPSSGNVRIWHDKHGLIAYGNNLYQFRDAYNAGRSANNPKKLYSSSGTMYLGDASKTVADGGDNQAGFPQLSTNFSVDVAKKRLLVEGIPNVSLALINQLVDDQSLVSANDVKDVIGYLNRGLLDPVTIKRFVQELHSTTASKAREHIQPNNLDGAYVNLLLKQGAGNEFLLAAIGNRLDIFTAQQYLAAGVVSTDVEKVKGLISESATSNNQAVIKQAMMIAGYHEDAATELATVMGMQNLSQHSQIETFFRMGLRDAALIKKYLDAGVSASELKNGNATHEKYQVGNRSDLISVSVSNDFTTTNHNTRYFARYDFVDSANKLLKGDLLETEAAKELAGGGPIGKEYTGSTSSWSGKSNPANLVDGFNHQRESTAWATAEKTVTLNGSSWIEFALTEKVALTELSLTSQGGNGSNMSFKVQAQDKNGNWQDASAAFNWTPGSAESTYKVTLNTNGLPYRKYRLLGLSGTYADSLWLKEVNFNTQALTTGILAHQEPTGSAPTPVPDVVVVSPEVIAITEDNDDIRLSTAKTRNIDALDGHDVIVDYDESAADAEETFRGGAGDDQILSGSGRDLLYGGAGQDVLIGAGGNDLLDGGEGDDALLGGAGSDHLQGQAGNDLLKDYEFEAGNLYANHLQGGAGDDVLRGAGVLDGGSGSDYLLGSEHNDKLYAAAGNDDVATDVNYLAGFAGNDQLTGSHGKDTLDGGVGDDQLAGGNGDDVYVVGFGEGNDTITEAGGNDKLRFVGDKMSQDQIWFQQEGNDLKILVAGETPQVGSAATSSQRVSNYFAGDNYKIENLLLKDSQLSSSEVDLLVSYMAGKQAFDFQASAGSSGATIADEINRLWGVPNGAPAQADSAGAKTAVAITNASFEGKVISQNYALERDVPGWTITGSNTASFKDEGHNATHDGAPDGVNLMQLDNGGSISQTLSETFDASADYQLQVDLANYKYGYISDVSVKLWAGSVTVGQVYLSATKMTDLGYGKWSTMTIDIDGAKSSQANGQALRLEVSNPSDDSPNIIGAYNVYVDNLRLAKLTGAMATFDTQSEADGGLQESQYRLEPVIVAPV